MVTLAPSMRQSPSWRLVRCTKRSSELSSAAMKPKPFSSRHCFTVPVHLPEVASLAGCCKSLLPPTGSCPTAAGASVEALAVSAEALAVSAEALVVAESTAGEPSAASAVSKGAPTSVAAGTSASVSAAGGSTRGRFNSGSPSWTIARSVPRASRAPGAKEGGAPCARVKTRELFATHQMEMQLISHEVNNLSSQVF